MSSTGYKSSFEIGWGGAPGDKPLVGDFDGDGKGDLIIYRSVGMWYILKSSAGYSYGSSLAIQWGGAAGDTPLVGDIDGDRKGDLIIWRTNGTWYILESWP